MYNGCLHETLFVYICMFIIFIQSIWVGFFFSYLVQSSWYILWLFSWTISLILFPVLFLKWKAYYFTKRNDLSIEIINRYSLSIWRFVILSICPNWNRFNRVRIVNSVAEKSNVLKPLNVILNYKLALPK